MEIRQSVKKDKDKDVATGTSVTIALTIPRETQFVFVLHFFVHYRTMGAKSPDFALYTACALYGGDD